MAWRRVPVAKEWAGKWEFPEQAGVGADLILGVF
jgi:hypothetical protein